MIKPLIGISGSLIIDSSGSFAGYRRSYVNHDYILSVIKNGGVPVIIPFNEDLEIVRAQVSAVDAVLLSGGHDIVPQHYEEEPRQRTGSSFPARDLFDFELLRQAVAQNKPVLGICRGMQLINVFFKGSLYQDLSYIDKEVYKHDQSVSPTQVTHTIELTPGSKLHQIFGEDKMMVNSFHHQVVKRLGDGLRIGAAAKDGVVESIEHETAPFIVGVQWHPEMLHAHEEKMNRLFDAFIRAAM